MKSLDIYDLISIIKDEYSVGEIISNLDIDDVFQCIDDSEMLEDLITVAVNEAISNAAKTAETEMSAITGGLNMPGLF